MRREDRAHNSSRRSAAIQGTKGMDTSRLIDFNDLPAIDAPRLVASTRQRAHPRALVSEQPTSLCAANLFDLVTPDNSGVAVNIACLGLRSRANHARATLDRMGEWRPPRPV